MTHDLNFEAVLGGRDRRRDRDRDGVAPVLVVFTGGSAGPTSGDDPGVNTFLENKYGAANVTYISDGTIVPADVIGKDLLVISSTVGSGSIRGKFDQSSIGILCWERLLYEDAAGDFCMCSTDNDSSDTSINVVLDTHAIMVAAGLSNGVVVIGASENRGAAQGTIPSGTAPLAEKPGTPADKYVTACDVGGDDQCAGTFSGRRVGFPQTGSGFDTLNAAGLALWEACLDWAQGAI